MVRGAHISQTIPSMRANSLYETCVQVIKEVAFIQKKLTVQDDEYNYYDSLHARLIEGIGH